MSKQTARQLTRQERRREEQQRREEERRHAARRKRITIFSIIGVVALAVAGLVYLVVAQSQTPANAAYPVVDNISCQSTEQGGTHIHAHVTMYVNGTKTPIPANVGIASSGPCAEKLPFSVKAPGYGGGSIWQERCEINAIRFYALNFFSTLLSSTAFVATVIELALMASAPTAGLSRIPSGYSTPAATGMAITL